MKVYLTRVYSLDPVPSSTHARNAQEINITNCDVTTWVANMWRMAIIWRMELYDVAVMCVPQEMTFVPDWAGVCCMVWDLISPVRRETLELILSATYHKLVIILCCQILDCCINLCCMKSAVLYKSYVTSKVVPTIKVKLLLVGTASESTWLHIDLRTCSCQQTSSITASQGKFVPKSAPESPLSTCLSGRLTLYVLQSKCLVG